MYEFRLIGYPIKHSLSPWIHGQFLKQTKVSGHYELYEMADFERQIKLLKETELNGFNVTVPYKEAILPYIDQLDESAQVIGAVNTVLVKDGKWIGYNTDGLGYVRALQEAFPVTKDLQAKAIVLLGAGGAAKGIFAALEKAGARNIVIANRTVERAEAIISKAAHSGHRAIALRDVEADLQAADIIIHTSSVGMKPNSEDVIVDLPQLKKDAIVSDIVYQPIETSLLKQAKAQGAFIHHGHTMLLYQAQYAFEIWTGKRPAMNDLAKQLKEKLEG